MSERYGIVYMGSKEKILHLIDYIFQREYKKKYFIDLFAGGFSVSGYALAKTNFKVISNDLNKYVISLYREIINGGKTFDIYKYDWISRDTFLDVRDNPQNYQDWYVGYVLNVWSFGCNQKDYLYAKDLEEFKHTLHMAIVFNDFSLINSSPLFKGLNIPDDIRNIDYKKHPAKRIAFMQKLKQFISITTDDRLQNLERLEQMENITQMEHLNTIKSYSSKDTRLSLYSMDYKHLYDMLSKKVLEDAVIYCDPPYENTKQYMFGQDFDYNAFWAWFKACPYSVYVSSYKAPNDVKPLNFDFKQVNLDNGNKGDGRYAQKKKAVENIYWNGKGNAEPTFLDQLFDTGGEN